MNTYDSDNLPETFYADALPEEMLPEARKAVRELMNSELIIAQEVRAAYVYNRKGEMSFTPFGQEPNRSYQRPTDDVIVQLTIRIPAPATYTTVKEMQAVAALDEKADEIINAAERQQLEAEITREEAKVVEAQKAVEQKRAALENLRKKGKK